MADPIWLRHEASFAHDIPGHPERPARLLAIERMMSEAGWFGCAVTDAPAATREQLLEVHRAEHVDLVETLCARGGGPIDQDTSVVAASWPAALHAAGGAAALATALLDGSAPSGVAALRPPGHHAERDRAMGFCLFNNVAVAAAHALRHLEAERVLILDWDVHHGNGTNEIFHDSDRVLFASIHQWPLYPGTGAASDVGRGDGTGFTVNLPVPPGSGDETFCSLVEHVVVPLAREYRPSLVLVSAGFDAHEIDPLASCRVTAGGFAAMTGSMRRVCAELGVPMGLVLEGGYSLDALAKSMAAVMPVLVAPDPPEGSEAGLEVHPLAAEAGRRLERYFGSIFRA